MGEGHAVPAPRGVADRRMARRPRCAERLLDLQPTRRRAARATRTTRQAALENRTRLQAAQGRARAGALRGPLLARVVSPHRPGHRRARIPHTRTTEPFSPAAGLTLPQ